MIIISPLNYYSEIKKDFIVAKYVDKLFLDKEYQEFDSQTLSKVRFILY